MSGNSPTAPGFDAQPTASLVGEILDNRYRITRKLGEGGMGEVYAADHIHIERSYAIKLLRPEIVSNPEAVTRFRQEARSSSSIGHQNIIRIDDFGQLNDGRIYMCMELLNGAALNDMLTQPLPVDRLLNILIQTGHGLAAAHARGIVHRDMKPENIFVTIGPNGEDIPKILDFGIAKVAGNDGQNHLTRTGTIFGTPFYMAPEQALGNPVDARTDIYAVGVIMYECFAGSLPFQGESFMGILTQHITAEPEPVAQRAAKAGRALPPGLAEVITRCLQKNPAQRFATMDDLVNVLIQIYRGIAGPGMSTYMEAFPASSSAHVPMRTPAPTPPPPMMGGTSGAAPTQPSVPVAMSGGHASQPNLMAAGGSSPAMIPGSGPNFLPSGVPSGVPSGMPSGPSAAYQTGAASSVGVPAQKSKLGLILGAIVVVALAGIVAFVVLNKKDGGGGAGAGSGKIGSGSQHGVAGSDGPAVTIDAGQVAAVVPDAAQVAAAIDAGEAPPAIDAGQVALTVDAGNPAPGVEVVRVLLLSRNGVDFEVYENGAKILDGPAELEVPKGERRSIVIKAKGFKDKPLVVDTAHKRTQFSLDRVPSQVGPGHSTPTGPNCANVIADPRSKACVAQYCAKHPDDESKCGLE
ncbi:MAG TPA: serine/threonine-protein kinase [Kofleriaceae bacterium]|nr:serine/threonine-protein kinase [Kofleriaceae bacterium]